MVTYDQLLDRIISDGIAEVREAYTDPEDHHKRDGAIEGFEACRGKTPTELVELWREAEKDCSMIRSVVPVGVPRLKDTEQSYWKARYKTLQIEFVLNVCLGRTRHAAARASTDLPRRDEVRRNCRNPIVIQPVINFLDPRLPPRFWEKVLPEPNSGCWLWIGAIANGYGSFRWEDRMQHAHTVTIKVLVGPIPEGLEPDHLCRNTLCCNPNSTHLELVSHRTNLLRGSSPIAKHATTISCPKGHPYDETNTMIKPDGSRGCRQCNRDRAERRRRRNGIPFTTRHCRSCGEVGHYSNTCVSVRNSEEGAS